MNESHASPPLTNTDRPPRTAAALLAAAILFYFCITTGPAGIGALIGVLAVLPWVRMLTRNVYSTILSAAASGALVGAAIEGTEETPPAAAAVGNALHMLQIIGPKAIFIGVLAAGVGGVMVTAYIRHRAAKLSAEARATDTAILARGRPVFVLAFVYALIAMIAIPGLTGIRGHSARKQMESSLRNLVAAQQDFHAAYGAFADNIAMLPAYKPDRDVVVVIDGADPVGWTAHATHPRVTTTCRIKALIRAPGSTTPDDPPECQEARRWF